MSMELVNAALVHIRISLPSTIPFSEHGEDCLPRRFRSTTAAGICTPYLIGTALALLAHDKISCFSLTTSIEDQMFYLASRGFRCIAHDRLALFAGIQ